METIKIKDLIEIDVKNEKKTVDLFLGGLNKDGISRAVISFIRDENKTLVGKQVLPKIPFSLDEFEQHYNELLNFHKSRYVNNNELSFIDWYLEKYSNGAEILKKNRFSSPLTAIENRWLDIVAEKGYLNNIELDLNQICKSLKQRKRDIKAELKKITPTAPAREIKQLKTLNDFIFNINNKETFMQELKTTFPTEKGKSIKAIIDILTDAQIIIYGTKEFRQFYNELKTYFNRNIGTYQGINDVKEVDKETTNTVYKKLNTLIIKHKTS